MKHIQHKKLIISLLFFGATFFPGSVFGATFAPDEVLLYINESRFEQGKDVLIENRQLTQAAQAKANDMFSRQYFSHDAPDGTTPWYWIDEEEYPYAYAGENLAVHFTNAFDQHNAWMASPAHRKNLLSDTYRETGIAVKEGILNGRETIITVEMFGARDNAFAMATPKIAPAYTKKAIAPIQDTETTVKEYIGFAMLGAIGFFTLLLIVDIGIIILMFIQERKKQQEEEALMLDTLEQ